MFENFYLNLYMKVVIVVFILIVILIIYLYSFVLKKREYFPAQNNKSTSPEVVIVLHGIAKTNRITYLLSKRIANAGFDVYNITYPSTKFTIQELADFLNNKINELSINKKKRVNIVGHSMGGLITRVYINKYKPKNIHRVVMIGTPNHGSELADKLKDWKIYKLKFGTKSGRQLGTDLEGLSEELGKVNYDLGIIAGISKTSPILSLMLPNDDDGIVSVESTKLDGMKEHIIMNFAHTPGIMYKSVADQTINYLKNGKFDLNKK